MNVASETAADETRPIPMTERISMAPENLFRQSEPTQGLQVSVADWVKSLAVIDAVAQAKDRNDAITALVRTAAAEFPASNTRCGIGTTRLKRYYDQRLGWLGPASELFQQADLKWNEDAIGLATRCSMSSERTAEPSNATSESIRLNIDDITGLGRCVLWIEGGSLANVDRAWLRRALPSLRAMIWQHRGGLAEQVSRVLSALSISTRVYLGLAASILILLSLWPASYRVRCTTVVRTKSSRIVAAPFDATMLESHVVPGDAVNAGDLLLTLDGRPLRLELETVEAQIGQANKERDVSLVSGRVAESQQATLRVRELNRRRELLIDRLERLKVTSPIDGMVVMGDLERSVGAPLTTGQAVLEIAPLEQMRIELEIPEYEIGYVHQGSTARVRLHATEGQLIEQAIDVVYPSAELRDDLNVFVARIDVDNLQNSLRPGMRGEAIIYGPVRPWLWSLMRSGWEKSLWWVGY